MRWAEETHPPLGKVCSVVVGRVGQGSRRKKKKVFRQWREEVSRQREGETRKRLLIFFAGEAGGGVDQGEASTWGKVRGTVVGHALRVSGDAKREQLEG